MATMLSKKEILQMVTFDLGFLEADNFTLNRLSLLVDASVAFLNEIGIPVSAESATVNDAQIIAMYADYLYEKRKAPDTAMPRMLKFQINNRLLHEKMEGRDAT